MILVTGGAGFIGSVLVLRLAAEGERVRVLDDFSAEVSAARGERLAGLSGVEVLEGDIRDPGAVRNALAGVGRVVHLAAPSVRGAEEDPETAARGNIAGTLTVLGESRRAGVGSFVHASSYSVYGDAGDLPTTEATPPNPSRSTPPPSSRENAMSSSTTGPADRRRRPSGSSAFTARARPPIPPVRERRSGSRRPRFRERRPRSTGTDGRRGTSSRSATRWKRWSGLSTPRRERREARQSTSARAGRSRCWRSGGSRRAPPESPSNPVSDRPGPETCGTPARTPRKRSRCWAFGRGSVSRRESASWSRRPPGRRPGGRMADSPRRRQE